MYWGLAGLLSLVWLATLASRPLFNPDEGRYAEIPREMLHRRRLDHSALEWPRVYREAAAAILGNGSEPIDCSA